MLESVIIYSALFLGKLLNATAKEELKLGKKYIAIAKSILIILTATTFIYLNFRLTQILFLLLGFIIFIFLRNIYLLIGLATFLSFFTTNPILLLSFIFLLTLAHSSLSSLNKKEMILSSVYFAMPFSLILIENFINANSSIFTGFVAGGLLAQLKGP